MEGVGQKRDCTSPETEHMGCAADSSALLFYYGGDIPCCFDSIGRKTQSKDKLRVLSLAQESLRDMAGSLHGLQPREGSWEPA